MDELEAALADDLRTAWHRFIDLLVPHRPALYAYCRRLAGNLWDAEDLVQETLLRAFGQWGVTEPAIRNPRAYLLRAATNVWIDAQRRLATERRAVGIEPDATPAAGGSPETTSHVRDAAARLVRRLSPQERAAVVLKEAFDMTLDDIAQLLGTTTGAVKAALHRGRDRLRAPDGATSHRPPPSPDLLDRFVDRYEAKDVAGLVALMLDGASAENVGNSVHVGCDDRTRGVPQFLHKVVHGHDEWPVQTRPEATRLLRAELQDEPILLSLVTRWGSEALEVVFRLDEQDGRIARIRAYGFCPETMQAVGEALGLPVRTGLYRAPTPAPGAGWPEEPPR
jgi:RNA polymerase sigma-70 factor (ECF subfamily)